MRRHPHLSESLLRLSRLLIPALVLIALPAYPFKLLLDSDFRLLGGFDKLTLTSDRQPSAPVMTSTGACREITIGIIARNLRNNPTSTGAYTDTAGCRRHAPRPGVEFVMVNTKLDTLRVCVRSMPLPQPDCAGSERFHTGFLLRDTLIAFEETRAGKDSGFHSGHPAPLQIYAGVQGINVCEPQEQDMLISCPASSAISSFFEAGVTEAGVAAMPGGKIEISRLLIASEDQEAIELTALDSDSLNTIFATSRDPLEGYWQLLDYTADDTMLRPGGNYSLAMVRSRSGDYRLIYLAGATINSGAWKPGQIKAILSPGATEGAFRLQWFDSEGNNLDPEAAAQTSMPGILTLQFPHLTATMRLQKVKTPPVSVTNAGTY